MHIIHSLLQLPLITRVGGKNLCNFLKMYKLSVALVCVGLVACGPVPDAEAGHQGYSSGPKCHQNVDKQCHQKPIQKERQECHEEYDVVIDTVYHEQCEDVVTRHCQYSHTQVIVPGGHRYIQIIYADE